MTHAVPVALTEQLRQIAAAEPALSAALAQAGTIDAALQQIAEAAARTGLPIDLDAARAAMTQFEGSAMPLNDEALDAVAGGGVNVWQVLTSVVTVGFVCAAASVIEATQKRDCGAFFRD